MEQTKQSKTAKIFLAALLSAVVAIAMLFAILPATAVTAHADEKTVDLSTLTEDYTAQDGETLTGTLSADVKIAIADKATVTLQSANVTSKNQWAGLTCLGDATIVLDGENVITTEIPEGDFLHRFPCVYVPVGSTLTIQGEGSLNARCASYGGEAAAIGAGSELSCGNIVIKSGSITAFSDSISAAIGGANKASCGDITIEGGTITATGGERSAAIGGSRGGSCGNITITGGTVTATTVFEAAAIGSACEGSCGNITITGGTVTANGGGDSAAIGGGRASSCGDILISGGTVAANADGDSGVGLGPGADGSSCGNITVTADVTGLTATMGFYSSKSIGAGWNNSTCGTITVGGVTYPNGVTENPFVYPKYSAVTFYLNGGTINSGEFTQYREGVGATLPTDLSKEHCFFAGWYADANFTGDAVTAIGTDAKGEQKFWAKFEGIPHKITYHPNGGEWNGEYPETYPESFGLTLPTDLSRDHFAFAGWYGNEDLSGDAVTAIGTDAAADLDFWAKWDPVCYVTYHLNGGEWNGAFVREYREGIGMTLPTNVKKDHGVFLGWYASVDLSGDAVTEIGTDATGDLDFYAKWDPVLYIIYHLNGGWFPEKTMERQTFVETYHEGESVTLRTDVKGNNKVFVAWYDSEDFAGDTAYFIRADESGDKEYWARWKPTSKIVNIGGLSDGWTAQDGAILTGELKIGKVINIAAGATVTFDDAIFRGNPRQDGKAGINLLGDATIILKGSNSVVGTGRPGIYVPPSRTLVIKGDGSLNVVGDLKCAGIGSFERENSDIGNAHITGYIHIQSGTVNATGGGYAAAIGSGFNGHCTGIVISGGTVVAHGGERAAAIGSGDGVGGVYGWKATCGNITISGNVTSVTAYSGGGGANAIGAGSGGSTCDGVNIAGQHGAVGGDPYIFAPERAPLHLHLNGGVKGYWPIDSYSVGYGALPNDLTKDHYHFVGWYDNAELTGKALTAVPATATGEQEYWAKWELNTSKVTLNLNGGVLKVECPTEYRETVGLTLPTYLYKEHYHFVGWYNNKDLTGDPIAAITPDDTGDLTFWAKWEINTYKITYVWNGGETDTHESYPTSYAEGVGATVADPTRYYKVFGGWYDNPQFTGDPYPRSQSDFNQKWYTAISAEETGDITLYARWLALSHGISYHLNGGVFLGDGDHITSFREDEILPLPTNVGKFHQAFDGWFRDSDFGWGVGTAEGYYGIELWAKWVDSNIVDLSLLAEGSEYLESDGVTYIAKDGEILTGTLKDCFRIVIADGATVTVRDLVIQGTNDETYNWAGVTLQGSATLILEGESTVVGFFENNPGIYVPENSTLTIQGKGRLDVSSNGAGAGIGGGKELSCGNIVIEGGVIHAVGGKNAAAIGGGENGRCGDITIKNTVYLVEATKDADALFSVGAGSGENSTCGKITVGDEEFAEAIAENFRYAPGISTVIDLIDAIPDEFTYTPECTAAIEAASTAYAELDESLREYVTNAEKLFAAEIDLLAAKTKEAIENLPDPENITLEHKDTVQTIRADYESLPDEKKEIITEDLLKKLEAAETALAAAIVTDRLSTLPEQTDGITLDDREAIEAARAAYDELTDEQKKNFPKELLEKLEAAEVVLTGVIVKNELDKLPESTDGITLNHKDAIEAARAAYETLNDEQKKNFPKELLDKLEAAEVALTEIIVRNELNKLPKNYDDITLNHKGTVEAASAAYGKLNDSQKETFSEELRNKLIAAEQAILILELTDTLLDLPVSTEITLDDKDAVLAARAKFEKLTEENKQNFPQQLREKLEALEQAILMLEAKEAIEALPAAEDVKADDQEAIEAARAAYDALNEKQKENFSEEVLGKLEAAEVALAEIIVTEKLADLPDDPEEITPDHKSAILEASAAYEKLSDKQKESFPKELSDKLKTAEQTVLLREMNELFKQLPAAEDVTLGDKATIENAYAAYDALTGDLKEQLPKDGYDKLIAAKRALEVLEVKAAIENLPADDAVTPDDRDAIEAARAAYGALDDEQKKQISDVTLKKLTDAEDALAAAEVTKTIDDLPQSGITPDDRGAIEAARAAYEKLTGEQKSRVSSETLTKLEKAEVDLATAIVTEKLNGLDLDNVTPDNADAIEAARAAYEALTDEEKKSFPQELLEQLEKAEVGLATAIVTEQLAGVDPENVKESDKDAIAAARAAYDKLTDEEKKSFPQELLEKLEKSELNYAILGVNTEMAKLPASADEITTAHKAIIEAARAAYEALDGKIKEKFPEDVRKRLEAVELAYAVATVTEPLATLPDDPAAITTAHKSAIEAARAAYDKLADGQKNALPEGTLAKIEAAELAYAVATVTEPLATLPDDPTAITTAHKNAIEAARAAYGKLTGKQIEALPEGTLAKIEAAELNYEIRDVNAQMAKLPASADGITTAHQAIIEAARAAYEELTDEVKKKVPEATLARLEAAEVALATATITEKLNGLDLDNVRTSDKDAIEAARAAYDKLTDEEKKNFPQDLLEKLQKAEVDLATAIVTEAIDTLPDDPTEITPDDKDAIEAARAAYDELSDEEKKNFPQDLLEKLEKAEVALAIALIDALPDEITADDQEKISDARYQYDHLSDEQKKEISDETLAKLKAAEVALTKALIEALPGIDEIRLADKEAIDRARATYENLSEDQKAEIPDGTLDELEKREAVLTVLLIEALPEAGDVTEDDRAAVEEARAYYDALPDGQKEQIREDTLSKLKAAEEALALLDAENAIGALPEGEITLDDRDAIEAARAAYETLTDEQKKNFPAEELEKIVAAEKALAAAEKNKADTEAANDVADTIGDLPATGSVTLADKTAIDAARAAYDELTDDQKKKVPADVLEKLEAAEAAYKTLDDTAKADAVKALIAEIGAVEYNEETKAKIEAVRAAYEALSGDQKKLVDNYTVLTEAEATYEAKEAEANTPKGLSGAAIAWIVIGSVLVIGIAAFLVFWLVFQKKTLAALFAAIGGFFAGLFGKKKAEAAVEENGHVSKRKNGKRTRRFKKNKAKQARKMRKKNS